MSDYVIYHKHLKRVPVDFIVICFWLFTTTVAVYLKLWAHVGTSKGKGIFIQKHQCLYLYTCNVLKLLSAAVGTLVIDSVDKEALGSSVG